MKRQAFLLGVVASCVLAKAADEIIKPTGAPNDRGPKPLRNQQGAYDCMLESMKRGHVTEPRTARRIIRWSDPVEETWQRYAYWAIELEYETAVVFGKSEVTVRALVRGGIVHAWLYVGSNEPVP